LESGIVSQEYGDGGRTSPNLDKFSNSSISRFRPVPKYGLSESVDGRLLEREGQLRHLKESRFAFAVWKK
jgi:hypothetical protein